MTGSTSDSLVTLGDAARELNIPYVTLYANWKNGRIPHQRAGSAILVKVSEVKEAMKDYRPRRVGYPVTDTATA